MSVLSALTLLRPSAVHSAVGAGGVAISIPAARGQPAANTTLQGSLPKELAAKFEKHKREAEALVANKKASAVPPQVLPSGSSDVGIYQPSPRQSKAHQRSASRPRSVKHGAVMLEDLDNRRLLDLQLGKRMVVDQGDPPSMTPRRGSEASLKPDRRNRASDDCMLLQRHGGPSGRQMYDKRSLRRRNQAEFLAAIQDWRAQHLAPGGRPRRSHGCHVSVRVRPIFEKEQLQGEFEVVTVREEWGEVVVHNCLFHADLVRMMVHHSGFCFPRTFSESASNEDVYAECGLPLVAHALGGQPGTLFMFGQTGSGKTYTMNAIMELAAREIFSALGCRGDAAVRLKAFEVAGKKCFDLLPHKRTELKLLDDQCGRTNIVGAVEAPVHCAEECLRLLRDALSRRATAGHARNDESSRSHCICILDLNGGGSLVLVDCAGTERRQDSDQHSSERMRESAEINSSLHALKECIRHRCKEQQRAAVVKGDEDDEQKQVHVPYRDSQLTRVLHESFTRPGSYLAAIGTISPTAMDTEHTLSTLKTLQLLLSESGNSDTPNFEQRIDIDPKAMLRSSVLKTGSESGGGRMRPSSTRRRILSQDSADSPSTLRVSSVTGGRSASSLAKFHHNSAPVTPSGTASTPVLATVSPDVCGLAGSPLMVQLSGGRARIANSEADSRTRLAKMREARTAAEQQRERDREARWAEQRELREARLAEQREARNAASGEHVTTQQRPGSAPGTPVFEPSSRRPPVLVATLEQQQQQQQQQQLVTQQQQQMQKTAAEAAQRDEQWRKEVEKLQAKVVQLEAELVKGTTVTVLTSSELGAAQGRAEAAESRIRDLETKNQILENLFRQEQEQRKRTHNMLLDLKGQIRVFCRIRPLLMPAEQADESATLRRDMFSVDVCRSLTSVDGLQRQERRAFQFDTVFGPSAQQEEVFREVQDLVQSAVDGYNVTIMAYGQTGAGKTHTMYGGRGEQRGVVPRTIDAIFKVTSKLDPGRFSPTVKSYLVELYKNDLVDLLAIGKGTPGSGKLDLRRDVKTGDIIIENVEEREVATAEELMKLLEEGVEHRHVASTQMNADSSRSHLFLTISIEVLDKETETTLSGKVRLCDLAGSERPKKSGASGDVMKEAIEINKALTALGDVIEALTRGGARGLVPYRNHKLTQLLSDSLGGTSKTLMFVNVSPARADVEETMNSLTYASRARRITNETRPLHAYSQASQVAPRCHSVGKPSPSPVAVPHDSAAIVRRKSPRTTEDLGDDFNWRSSMSSGLTSSSIKP